MLEGMSTVAILENSNFKLNNFRFVFAVQITIFLKRFRFVIQILL